MPIKPSADGQPVASAQPREIGRVTTDDHVKLLLGWGAGEKWASIEVGRERRVVSPVTVIKSPGGRRIFINLVILRDKPG